MAKINVLNYDPSDDFTTQEFEKNATKKDVIDRIKMDIRHNKSKLKFYKKGLDDDIIEKYNSRIKHKRELLKAVENSDELINKILNYGQSYYFSRGAGSTSTSGI